MENISRKFENMRHGHKEDGELSPKGWEQSTKKGYEIFNQFESAPEGTILYLISSNIQRVKDTKEGIETVLLQEARKHQGMEIVSIKDVERLEETSRDLSKKYIITDLGSSTLLGYNPEAKGIHGEAQNNFSTLTKLFEGDENLVGEVWIAQEHELQKLHDKIEKKFNHVDVKNIKPANFKVTPEDQAMRYLTFLKRTNSITEKYFPSHHSMAVHLGHNISSDSGMIPLMGKELSLESYEELGGSFRDFTESASFEFTKEGIISTYRGDKFINPKNLDEIIEQLKMDSYKRKESWKNY